MKVRLPRFLVLRRRYEVDETLWIVRAGRPAARFILRKSMRAGIMALHSGQSGVKLATKWRLGATSGMSAGGRKIVLFAQWRRMPKDWELSFVVKMKSMEAQGIQFPEVLRTYLPSVIGEAPSEVLLNWVGRQTRHQPKRFVNAVTKMFGKTSKSVISGIEKLADPEAILLARRPVDPPYKSLVDAIRAADGE